MDHILYYLEGQSHDLGVGVTQHLQDVGQSCFDRGLELRPILIALDLEQEILHCLSTLFQTALITDGAENLHEIEITRHILLNFLLARHCHRLLYLLQSPLVRQTLHWGLKSAGGSLISFDLLLPLLSDLFTFCLFHFLFNLVGFRLGLGPQFLYDFEYIVNRHLDVCGGQPNKCGIEEINKFLECSNAEQGSSFLNSVVFAQAVQTLGCSLGNLEVFVASFEDHHVEQLLGGIGSPTEIPGLQHENRLQAID